MFKFSPKLSFTLGNKHFYMWVGKSLNTTERQSVSEIKMGKGSPIYKKLHVKLWNNFRIILLSVKIHTFFNMSFMLSSKRNIYGFLHRSREISVCKKLGQKSVLNSCDFQTIGWYGIKTGIIILYLLHIWKDTINPVKYVWVL